jgi:hypothetical protein
MPRTTKRTPKRDWKAAFLAELAATGNVYRSARKAKKPRSEVYKAKAADEGFAAAWAEALVVAVEAMEGEAHRRAFAGTLRPVYQGGKRVGAVREYSDTLTIFLLKAHSAKYRGLDRVVVAGDPAAPVKHDHAVSVTGRIEHLAAAFAGAADRAGEGGVPGDGP